jgi:hypothetical protein
MVVCTRRDSGTAAEVDAFLDFVLDFEGKVVSEDVHNMLTMRFRPGILTRSDQSLARYLRMMKDFPRAHPSKDFIR